MKLSLKLETKPLEKTSPGELVRLQVKARSGQTIATCIVLERNENSVFLGCLHRIDGRADVPFHFASNSNRPCLSFGLDWMIVPVVDHSTYAGNRQFAHKPGVLHIVGSDPVIAFGDSDEGFGDTVWFALRSKAVLTALPDNSAPIARWNIFANEGAYTLGRDPLLEVSIA